ncbi:CPBP family intramembrane metalloprotease [Serratia marcescens]|uniref:CPBP family intramembrane glutamic endopeptidase n=1 Tax=Serratia TaxID=613 RepID=UPI0018D860DB|nr:CPBP family intramembrane metalloprotease [Serratia marcescens]MBH2806454.1 CPBP family intramembrane metalloprotease [Serratia marcescens]MBH2958650.1 CPBP family intramembrane metalloprotease [Serratia marcescens]MBN5232948.1 CPBP family intramembrane metalloprotease [Serratia marcescens]MBN5368552.1 CPBP family intramembrane metalloprotease [Serratia marcescens]
MVDNAFIARTRAVNGCFSMFLLMFLITFIPLFIENRTALMRQGLLLPLLYGIEFVAIFSLYLLFFRRREGLGKGEVKRNDFALLLFALLVIQFIFPRLMGVEKTETWVMEQVALPGEILALNAALLVFVVPVYEEIVFRGCLFNALMYWFNDKVLWAALTVSVIFAVLHTQYTDWRTLAALVLISLVLTAARVRSKGIYLPIGLHMTMNGVVMAASYALN